MNFEDIVDMDWLNSHTTDSLPSPPTTLVEDEDMLLYSSPLNSNNEEYNYNLVTPSTTPVMPTIEQIKQLIELAKRQLALREQQQQHADSLVISEPTPEPESPPPTTMVKLEELFPVPSPSNTTTTTVSPESLMKTDQQEDDLVSTPKPLSKTTARRDSFASISDEGPMSLEAYAETGGIDIKKLSSKERRQLRNKISARNFRVRRKEYITTLEGQVDDHKKANEQLLNRLNNVEEENKQLKMQIDNLKRQNQSLLSSSSTLVEDANTTSSSNYKDISILGSNPSDTYRQDTSILVEC